MSRQYVSAGRAIAAQRTRARILDAAQLELRAVGYHAMTMGGLARRAEVSPQTIYNSLGSKAAVIKALYDVLLAGDEEPVPMNQRPEFIAVLNQPDAMATVRAYLALGGNLYRRVGEFLGILLADGPGADTELKAFVTTIDDERRTGNEFIIRHIETTFDLPTDLPAGRAIDVLWTITSFEVVDRLVRRCGWSVAEYETWAADVLIMSISGPASAGLPG